MRSTRTIDISTGLFVMLGLLVGNSLRLLRDADAAMYRAKELIFDKCLAGPQYDGRSFQINRVEPLSDKHAAYTADSAVSWWSLGYSLHREDRLIGIGDLLARDRSWRRAEATLSAILSARYSAPEVLVETGVPVSVWLTPFT
mgnify:CR=1 FL=1